MPSSTASDALIAQQLFFTDSGAGLGSLNNTFASAFRWYMDPYSTSRTVALNLLVLGTNGMLYSMSYVGEGAAAETAQIIAFPSPSDYWSEGPFWINCRVHRIRFDDRILDRAAAR